MHLSAKLHPVLSHQNKQCPNIYIEEIEYMAVFNHMFLINRGISDISSNVKKVVSHILEKYYCIHFIIVWVSQPSVMTSSTLIKWSFHQVDWYTWLDMKEISLGNVISLFSKSKLCRYSKECFARTDAFTLL